MSNRLRNPSPRRVSQQPPSPSSARSNTNVRMDYQSFSDTNPTTTTSTTIVPPITGNNRGATTMMGDNGSDPLSHHPNDTGAITNNAASTATSTSSNIHQYRGFGTSINDMFVDIQNERIDCCSITLCGILQSDRDRYLMNQIVPPSVFKRFLVHFMIPFCIFCAAGLGAMQIQDIVLNELVSVVLIVLFILYLLLQCSKGRYKRIDVRKDILFTKYQIQQQHLLSNMDDHHQPQNHAVHHHHPHRQNSNQSRRSTVAVLLEHQRPRRDATNQPNYYLGQTLHDMSCAHPCCMIGCYPVDTNLKSNCNDQLDRNHTMDENLCRCMYDYVCPSFCGSYLQCCGICAIAQEARDIETFILPPPYRRIDYISTCAEIHVPLR